MAHYRYQDYPRPTPSEQVHVRVHLDGAAGASECLWAHPLGADLYRVLNVPFFTAEVGLHDVVLAFMLDDEPEFVEVVARRTHVRFDFQLPDQFAPRLLADIVNPLGVAVERTNGSLYAANLPDRTHASVFQSFLESEALWFERTDMVGATHEANREDVSSNGGDT